MRTRLLNGRSDRVFVAFAMGIVATLTISLISLSLLQAALGSALLANRDSLGNYTSVVNDSTKLRLTLSMNSSTLSTGEPVEIEISEQNTLLLTNTVASGHDWPNTGLNLSPCGTLNYPIGFAIFKGYHLQNNLPSTDRLDLYGPGFYFCPLILIGINSYVFAPGSDLASINAGCSPNPCFAIPIQSRGSFTGFWSSSIPYLSSPTFHSFSPGAYTVVGGDEWGDLLVLHFVVS
jgi:hypothetical protein